MRKQNLVGWVIFAAGVLALGFVFGTQAGDATEIAGLQEAAALSARTLWERTGYGGTVAARCTRLAPYEFVCIPEAAPFLPAGSCDSKASCNKAAAESVCGVGCVDESKTQQSAAATKTGASCSGQCGYGIGCKNKGGYWVISCPSSGKP